MNKVLHISNQLYSVIIHLYPLEHQQVYGKQMMQTFQDMGRDAFVEGGMVALGNLWLKTLVDAVFSASAEHLTLFKNGKTMSRKSLMIWALILVFAVLTGYINLNATEVQAPLACILMFSVLSGFLQPKAAWRWAVLMAISVPLSYSIGVAFHYPIIDPPLSLTFDPKFLILTIPALLATYCGVFLNRALGPRNNQAS